MKKNNTIHHLAFSICLVLQFTATNYSTAQVVMNEFMAANTTGITNELGVFEDWIEIYNPGSTALNLAGYYFSDDPLNALLFQVPATNAALTTVPAGGYLRLWADNALTLGPHHLGFKLGKSGETVRLTAPNGTTQIDLVTFGAQSDNISYGRLPNGGSTFTTFSTPTPGSANTASNPGPQPTITNLFVNEVVAASSDYRDEEGKREDWVELYNAGTTALNIGGLYLSDELGLLLKWKIPVGTSIPAGGFYTVFADDETYEGAKHTNFGLKKGGEKVMITQVVAAGNAIVDSLTFPAMAFGASYGRLTNGSATKVLFGRPTPNASNNGGLLYLPEPIISVPSGKYTGTQTVSITHPLSGTTIRYTLDGSLPSSGSTLYTAPISIASTKTLRAAAFKAGYEQSAPADYAYLIGVTNNIPIVYLTTDPKNLYDNTIGIYTDGTNGIQQYCAPYPVNWAQDWERPCNYKMFLPDGTMTFDVDAGMQIDGVCSRNYKLKSLGMDLKEKEYGDEKIAYALFPQRTHSNYQRLKLRNGGQDYQRTGIRDMVNHQLLLGKVDIDAQAGTPVLVYINGTFHGIQNLQEKFTEEFFNAVYGANEDSLDIIKSPGVPWNELKAGSFAIYNQLHAYMETANMNDDAQFAYFQSQVDMDEFMNYWVSMIYMANTDWPANNLTIWREKKAGKKWRYCVVDTDGSTNNGLSLEAKPNANTFLVCNNATSTTWPNHKGSTLFLRKCLERPSFRNEFMQRTCSFIHLVYPTSRTNQFIDITKAQYQPNVPAHLALYASDNPSALGGTITKWSEYIDSFKTFFVQRPVFMRQHLQSFYGLTGTYNLNFGYTAATNGDVFVNWTKMAIPYNYQGTYFKNIPLRVTAVAKPGYVFSHWLETGQTTATIEFSTTSNTATLTPIFTSGGPLTLNCPIALVVTAPISATTAVVNYTSPVGTSTCATGAVSTTRISGLASGSSFPLGTNTVCFLATDGCGNTKTCCFTVTVNAAASSLVTLNCPPNQTVTAPTGATTAVVNYTAPTGTSNCTSGTVGTVRTSGLASGSAFPVGTNTVCHTATDGCGSTKSCCFTITVNAISSNLCQNVSVAPGNGNITVSGLPVGKITQIQLLTLPTFAVTYACDNCTAPSAVIPNVANGTYRVKIKLFEPNYLFICKREIDVTVSGTSTSTITLNCPTNQTITAPTGATSAVANYTAPVGTSTCTTGTVTTTRTSGLATGSAFPIGLNTVCYRANDGCNNSKTCCFNITVNGTTPSNTCTNITAVPSAGAITINGLPTTNKAITIDVRRLPTYAIAYSCFNTCTKPTQVVTGLTAGSYSILVKIYTINTSGGWTFDCQKDIPVTINSNLIGNHINEDTTTPAYFIKNLSMSPNPASDYVYFSGGENPPVEVGKLTLMDLYGREVRSREVNFADEPILQLSLNDLADGMYLVRMEFVGQRAFTRLLSVVR